MKRKFLFTTAAWGLAVLVAASPVMADDSQLLSMVQNMQDQMKEMQKTINQQNQKIQRLESQPAITTAAAGEMHSSIPAPITDDAFKDKLDNYMGGKDAGKWLQDLKFSGDFRLRWESVNYAKGNVNHSGNENRARFRLRYGFEKKFGSTMKVGFRLASGSLTNGNSTNQTLTGNFSNKALDIDRAYAIYTPKWTNIGPIEKTEIGGGKFANPFTRGSTEMIWDDDLNPEGLYEMLDFKLIDGEDFGLKSWFTAGQFILRESAHNSSTASNSELYAFQLGLTPEIKIMDQPLKFTNSISFYNYSDYAHNSTFTASGATLTAGNPTATGDTTTLAANNFRVLELYNAVEFKPVDFLPVFKPYFDIAVNTAENATEDKARGENLAWALGLKIGKAKKKGEWEIGYAYKYIEANSVVGAFADSDFNGAGRYGNVLGAKYAITDTLVFGITGFLDNNLNHDTLARDQWERRFFADLVWAF